MRYVDLAEVDQLREKLDPNAWARHVEIPYRSGRYWNRVRDLVRRDRFGEVVFAVERANGRIITVRSEEYPEGIYRVPTGGIAYGEDILDAVRREVLEELGLTASVEKFIGVFHIRFVNAGRFVPFHSFLFHVKETGGRLMVDATDDEVSDVMEADQTILETLAHRLLHIREDWRDWGRFRHLTTAAISQYMRIVHGQLD